MPRKIIKKNLTLYTYVYTYDIGIWQFHERDVVNRRRFVIATQGRFARRVIKIVFQYSASEREYPRRLFRLLDYKAPWEHRIPGVGVPACAHIIISIIILIKAPPAARNNTLHVMRASNP